MIAWLRGWNENTGRRLGSQSSAGTIFSLHISELSRMLELGFGGNIIMFHFIFSVSIMLQYTLHA